MDNGLRKRKVGFKNDGEKVKKKAKRGGEESEVTDIHKIEINTIKKVNSSGEIKNIIISDAKTQTDVSYNLSEENGDEEEEEKTREVASLSNCPICMERFNQINRLLISVKCGHGYCNICYGKLFKDGLAAARCPICRLSCERAQFVTVKFQHLETLSSVERVRTMEILESLKNQKFLKLLYFIKNLEENEEELPGLPVICYKAKLKKNRLDFINQLISQDRLKNYTKMKTEAIEAISDIEKSLKAIGSPSSNSVFHISKFLTDELVDRISKKSQ